MHKKPDDKHRKTAPKLLVRFILHIHLIVQGKVHSVPSKFTKTASIQK